MADDKLLPAKLHLLHPKFKSPYISIICCAVVVSFMVVWTFGELLIIDITLYGAALFLEYVALIKLRRIAAGEHRPFRIPLKIPGLIIMMLLPLSVYFIALTSAFINSGKTFKPLLFAIIILLSAELVWQVVRRWNGKLKIGN
jgi:amino acid transporter